jgi:uncharacterized protein
LGRREVEESLPPAELGGKTIVEPTEIPGVGQFAMFSDPDGNVVGVLREKEMR